MKTLLKLSEPIIEARYVACMLALSLGCAGAIQWHILIWDNKLSHTRMGIRYEYTRMGRPIHVRDKYTYGTEHKQAKLPVLITT